MRRRHSFVGPRGETRDVAAQMREQAAKAAAVPPQVWAAPPKSAHQTHMDHQQTLRAQQRQFADIVPMGNTAPVSPPKSLATASTAAATHTKQEAVARLAKKLARQMAQTSATPLTQPAGAVLHKLASVSSTGAGAAVSVATGVPSLAGNESWVDWSRVKTAAVHAARVTGDTAVQTKDDVAAAGVRVEHRVNPYDAPPPEVSLFDFVE